MANKNQEFRDLITGGSEDAYGDGSTETFMKRRASVQSNVHDARESRRTAWRKLMKRKGYQIDGTDHAYNTSGDFVQSFDGAERGEALQSQIRKIDWDKEQKIIPENKSLDYKGNTIDASIYYNAFAEEVKNDFKPLYNKYIESGSFTDQQIKPALSGFWTFENSLIFNEEQDTTQNWLIEKDRIDKMDKMGYLYYQTNAETPGENPDTNPSVKEGQTEQLKESKGIVPSPKWGVESSSPEELHNTPLDLSKPSPQWGVTNPVSTEYDRTDPSQRHARRMEDVLARGRPMEQFKINQKRRRGTPISELFHKDKRRR